MRLPEFAIKNHQFTLVMICLLVLSGIVSFMTMPRSEDPQVQPAGSSVIVIYPGGNPFDMEQLIVDPIEEIINTLEDIKEIESESRDGVASVGVEFLPGTDPDEKYSDVVQKVNSIREKLPENILSMEIFKWTITDVNIFQIALISDSAGFPELEEEAERLKIELERIPGVREVEIEAIPKQEVRVSLDLDKLALLRIPFTQVIGAVQDGNMNIPGGYVDVGTKRLNIKTSGSYRSLDEIRSTVVHSKRGKVVQLEDVADVFFSTEDNAYLARVRGRKSIFITVNQKERTNIFQISKSVKQRIEKFKQELPQTIELETVFDQSYSVSRRVTGFFKNLLQGLFLVGIVVFTAVSFRASIIVIMAIPISLLMGIGFVDLSHFGLQQMSIAGMVIALGLLVDNAIVVTENISRFMKMGYKQVDAAVQGTSQVGWAVVSATATTVLAFIPIIMMQDVTGDFIRSMPVTVVYTLTASLLLSLTLTPYLSEKFLKFNNGEKERPLRKGLNLFIQTTYRQILDFILKNPWKLIIVVGCIFILSLGLFPIIGVSFFPKAEKPQLFINVNLPQGTNLDKTNEVVKSVESVLITDPYIKNVVANVGHGNPRLYYNTFPTRHKSSYGQLFIELKEYNRKKCDRLINSLRERFDSVPGAKIEVKELEQGPPVEAPIAVKILGENLDVLKKISFDVEEMIRSIQGPVNITNPFGTTRNDLKVHINRIKAGMFGIPLSEIDRTIRASIAGLPITQYRDSNGKDYNIVIRLPFEEKQTLSHFDKIYITSRSGALIPLKQVASIMLSASPLVIDHYNLERSVTVTADVEGDFSIAKITKAVIKDLERYHWPKGYHYYIGGEQESRQESFGGMLRAVIIAVIAIFGVLVLQFRSYLQPFIVFVAIPLAMIGSLWALLITGNSFSFTAFIGFTSLVGIVVNNSILLVDYTNQLRREGRPLIASLKEAGEIRFIPIILTTATTIGGLLPLTLSSGTMWGPMGWTIIGGLLISTFLTLIVVPALYKLFASNG